MQCSNYFHFHFHFQTQDCKANSGTPRWLLLSHQTKPCSHDVYDASSPHTHTLTHARAHTHTCTSFYIHTLLLGSSSELITLCTLLTLPRRGCQVQSTFPSHAELCKSSFFCDVMLYIEGLAIDPADQSNGCLSYVKGSSAEPIRPHQPSGTLRCFALRCVLCTCCVYDDSCRTKAEYKRS